MTVKEFKTLICHKKVAVAGIGISNMPLIQFLVRCGADVTACDRKPEKEIAGVPLLKNLGVALKCGESYLNELHCDWFFRTPGMHPELEEVQQLRKCGTKITSEIELFFDLCPAQIIAVTGSDGKTTTTTLIGKMLEQAGYRCWIGGNIGNPLIGEIGRIEPKDKVVLELSSFQLSTLKKSPEIAVLTNISPNHLDWHRSMEEYVQAKMQIFLHQQPSEMLILNAEDTYTDAFVKDAKGKIRLFRRNGTVENGVYCKDGTIYFRENGVSEKIMDTGIIRIPGAHNIENYMAAIAAVRHMVSIQDIIAVAKTFEGVAHRLEFVAEKNGVCFYNDSIASTPTRTAAALQSFAENVILIAGGYDKKIPFDQLGQLIQERVQCLVLTGATSGKIKQAVEKAGGNVPVLMCKNLQQAVQTAYEQAHPGDVILLSPACASFDQFTNFEHRGNAFKEYVNKL